MNSSSEATVTPLAVPELRTGEWTRYGTSAVLGDPVTEDTLAALAESTRTAAQSQGYAVGWAEGRRAAKELAEAEAVAVAEQRQLADQRREQEHAAALAALALAAAHLHESVAQACARVEDEASGLAWDLVTTLVGRELASADGVDVVRRALALMPTEPLSAVRLHPADAQHAEELTEAGVRVVADATLTPGDALAEVADHVLDLRISTALERVQEVLR